MGVPDAAAEISNCCAVHSLEVFHRMHSITAACDGYRHSVYMLCTHPTLHVRRALSLGGDV
eukprot:m.174022 g.174022  ORF g.174022 m.174022 type:complete len:61 (-) comp18315_c0_seq1:18-200(-)